MVASASSDWVKEVRGSVFLFPFPFSFHVATSTHHRLPLPLHFLQDSRRMLHAVYRVGDMDDSIAYYRDTLGMQLLRFRDIKEVKRIKKKVEEIEKKVIFLFCLFVNPKKKTRTKNLAPQQTNRKSTPTPSSATAPRTATSRSSSPTTTA
jgi:hypothetical protein